MTGFCTFALFLFKLYFVLQEIVVFVFDVILQVETTSCDYPILVVMGVTRDNEDSVSPVGY